MRIKRLFVLAIVCVVALGAVTAAFAGGEQEGSDKLQIAYLPPNFEEADFYGQYYSGLVSGLDEYLDVEYELVRRVPETHDDHTQQLNIVEDVITMGVDYIVMAPTHYEGQQAAYRKINEAGIPLFIFNYSKPFPEEFEATAQSFIGYNHRDGGRAVAQWVEENYDPGARIAILYGSPTEISEQRASKDLLEEAGMEIIFEQHCNWSRQEAYDATERLMTKHDDVDVIVAVSSFTAMGAVRAAADAGELDRVDILGAGAILEELDSIVEGELTGAWYRDAASMGESTAEFISMHLDGREDEIPEVHNSEIVMIDSVEDIHEYINPVTYEAEGRDLPPLDE